MELVPAAILPDVKLPTVAEPPALKVPVNVRLVADGLDVLLKTPTELDTTTPVLKPMMVAPSKIGVSVDDNTPELELNTAPAVRLVSVISEKVGEALGPNACGRATTD